MATENPTHDPGRLYSDAITSSPPCLPLDDDEASLPRLPSLQKGQRSKKMARGCRFRDLGEAHRNITGRSISNSISNSASRSCSLSSDSWKPLSSHAGSLSCSDDINLQDLSRPSPSKKAGDQMKMDDQCDQDAATAPVTAQEASLEQADTSDSLVNSVYQLYQAHLDLSAPDEESPEAYTFEKSQHKSTTDIAQIESLRDGGATTRLGFHLDEANDDSILEDLQDAANGPGPAYQPRNLESSTCESVLFPKPLRVQSLQCEKKHTSTAVSMGGLTEDSDDDPFRYDKNPYKIFLHPSKEREVSAALKHISHISSHSRATIYTQDEAGSSAPAVCQTFLAPPPIPKRYREMADYASPPVLAISPGSGGGSTTPEEENGEFYDTSIIKPGRERERGAYEVKVVLQDKQNPDKTAKTNTGPLYGNRPSHSGAAIDMPSAVSKDERDEWETVGTSVGGVGSVDSVGRLFSLAPAMPKVPPPTAAPMPRSRLCHEYKRTGSSVADVSDESSCDQVPFDEYASTDRIVQPPSGGHEDDEPSEESLRIRNINGAKVPVITPKHRVHRVNGMMPQIVTPSRPGGGAETAAALARKMSNPFRQMSARRAQRRFSPTPLRTIPAQPDWGRSRFEFRNSMVSGYEAMFGQETTTETGDTSGTTGTTEMTGTTGTADNSDSNQRESGSSQNSNSTTHSFSFSLIPLPEAARLQAIERGSADYRGPPRVTAPPPVHLQTHKRKPLPQTPQTLKNWIRHPLRQVDATQTTMSSATAASYFGATPAALDASWNTTETPSAADSTWSATTRALRSVATRLRLDTIGSRREWQRLQGKELGDSREACELRVSRRSRRSRPSQSFPLEPRNRRAPAERRWSNAPHLYPWDYQYRQQLRWQKRQMGTGRTGRMGTNPELRAVATSDFLEQAGIPQDPEAFLSVDARHRRSLWFACMLAVSILLPFLSVMVYMGRLDCGLSWYTRGEVARLNERQRRTILVTMVLQLALWPMVLVFVIWRVVQ